MGGVQDGQSGVPQPPSKDNGFELSEAEIQQIIAAEEEDNNAINTISQMQRRPSVFQAGRRA